jgi:hypothetical protein
LADGTTLELEVDAARDPALLGAKAQLRLEHLEAGARRDVGLLDLRRQ